MASIFDSRPVYLQTSEFDFIINSDKITAIEAPSDGTNYRVYTVDGKSYFISKETYETYFGVITVILKTGKYNK